MAGNMANIKRQNRLITKDTSCLYRVKTSPTVIIYNWLFLFYY